MQIKLSIKLNEPEVDLNRIQSKNLNLIKHKKAYSKVRGIFSKGKIAELVYKINNFKHDRCDGTNDYLFQLLRNQFQEWTNTYTLEFQNEKSNAAKKNQNEDAMKKIVGYVKCRSIEKLGKKIDIEQDDQAVECDTIKKQTNLLQTQNQFFDGLHIENKQQNLSKMFYATPLRQMKRYFNRCIRKIRFNLSQGHSVAVCLAQRQDRNQIKSTKADVGQNQFNQCTFDRSKQGQIEKQNVNRFIVKTLNEYLKKLSDDIKQKEDHMNDKLQQFFKKRNTDKIVAMKQEIAIILKKNNKNKNFKDVIPDSQDYCVDYNPADELNLLGKDELKDLQGYKMCPKKQNKKDTHQQNDINLTLTQPNLINQIPQKGFDTNVCGKLAPIFFDDRKNPKQC